MNQVGFSKTNQEGAVVSLPFLHGDHSKTGASRLLAQKRTTPEPAAPLTVSFDGGYVHARSPESSKDGSFEVIVGKSTTGEATTTSFGLVSGYDPKPRRRLFEVLRSQGMQMNQAVTFLTDGGDTVLDVTDGLNPLAEHILDWFHITMRITVLNQMAKGVPDRDKGEEFEKDLGRV